MAGESSHPGPFQRVLVANRGEIACRVMRTIQSMGLTAIGVYSEVDADAPHVRLAHQALLLGPGPAGESYLNAERILAAARASDAEAIHPGYGFLSENAEFARACVAAGLVFIGPGADAIELMGDKARAKQRMLEAKVPCVPGYHEADQSDQAFLEAAAVLRFPVMVKAAAGGGGRGMRLVGQAGELVNALKLARAEAQSAFGSGDLILEAAIDAPRHVEIQVFADRHGQVVHLGERDCSVQRRHQKIIEEAPCPVMDHELRAAMGQAAVQAARSIGYVGAGTVEFLLDGNRQFYFLEMNTRLQVEHPVTELVTGLDLVALQIGAAQGQRLGLAQDEILLNGHAIEARLYAEDPGQQFLPATGRVDQWRPASGEGIRIDAGIRTGGRVTPFYDPLVAKVIAHGRSREEARRRLIQALKSTALFGVRTNKSFLIRALEKPQFIRGEATTAFLGESFSAADLETGSPAFRDACAGAVIQYELARDAAHAASLAVARPLLNWTSASKIGTPYRYGVDENCIELELTPAGRGRYRVDGAEGPLTVTSLKRDAFRAVLDIDGRRQTVLFNQPPGDPNRAVLQLSIDGRDLTLRNLNAMMAVAGGVVAEGTVLAPMHGVLLELAVEQGQSVAEGDTLAVLEAMKMQHEIRAPSAGIVSKVHFAAGAQVAADAVLMEIKEGT